MGGYGVIMIFWRNAVNAEIEFSSRLKFVRSSTHLARFAGSLAEFVWSEQRILKQTCHTADAAHLICFLKKSINQSNLLEKNVYKIITSILSIDIC